MQSETFFDVAASAAAVAAGVGLLYARESARSARDAAESTRRSVEVAERTRQAAARGRLRIRVERVGELVRDLAASSPAEAGTDDLSARTKAQCRVLNRAVLGLNDILPKAARVGVARSATELGDRVGRANGEIDGVLEKLTKHRAHSTYRPRQQVPWHRPTGVRSAAPRARRPAGVTRPPWL
ncbi:MAG TPA: hypothetical protein VII76_07690 [Acidimicrobiales bacterium]